MFHPSSLLLAWGAGIFALQRLDPAGIVLMAVLASIVALWADAAMLRVMLRRIRWLLVSVAVLFLWMTPGVFLPGIGGRLGITQEGAAMAVEHVARLLAIIALLALLLSRLSHGRIVAGLYTLLAPLGWLGIQRRAMAVRLMLTLEYVAEKRHPGWRALLRPDDDSRGRGSVHLATGPWRWTDGLFLGGLLACLLYQGWR